MKIMHLLQSPQFSGAENVVCQIIAMLKSEPDLEMVYCSQDGPIRRALEERNITFIPLKEFTISAVKAAIIKEKPDIIHAHDMRASYYAARACGKTPLISHIHNNAFNSRGISLKSIAYVYAGIKAKHIFWVSKSSYEGYAFHCLFKRKSTILYNIVDIDEIYTRRDIDKNKYDYDVIYIGRLTYQKNPQRLMNIFKLLVEKKKDVRIAVVGTGELEEEVKRLSSRLRISENVDFLGYMNNPLKVLSDSKVIAMASRWEGTPMCVLEAQSLGIPVVSTPTDGLRDIIVDGKNGYLSDDDDALAQRIYDILVDDDLRSRMKENSVKRIKKIMDKKYYISKIKKAYGLTSN